jgi:site-specific recombinase XerC
MANSHLRVVTPTEILRTVLLKRGKNADLRTREHLTVDEVEALIDDTRAIQGWLGHRSITSTAVYTALAPNRFKDFWRD